VSVALYKAFSSCLHFIGTDKAWFVLSSPLLKGQKERTSRGCGGLSHSPSTAGVLHAWQFLLQHGVFQKDFKCGTIFPVNLTSQLL
jgi:hypothetical protein